MMMAPISSIQAPVPELGQPEAPAGAALRHLRSRPVAMICAAILVFYVALAAVSYIRLPDSSAGERRFIGEWFEAKATTQHFDPLGIPLEYEPPRASALDLSERVNERLGEPEYSAEQLESWAPPGRLNLLLGTDIQGRSVFWRTLYAARMSMTIALGATIISVVLGATLGALAGYLGGWIDAVITWLFTTVASIPRILLILALAYSLKGRSWSTPRLELGAINIVIPEVDLLAGSFMLMLAMGLTTWVGFCRIMRGEIMKQKSMEYESAARALGLGRGRILIRHLLPNAFYLIIIETSLIFPLFIHLEVILSYLGLGVDEGVSWGQMINESLQEMIRTPPVWWQLAAATFAIFGVSIALNLFGDALRDALDPRLRGTR